MADIQKALARLENALGRAAEQATSKGNGDDRLAEKLKAAEAERDRLAREVETLRKAADEDAKLRAEAAEAVKSALADLRGLVREEGHANA